MADARLTMVSAQIDVENARFRASGKRIDFAGFFRAYVEGSDDPDAALEAKRCCCPPCAAVITPAARAVTPMATRPSPRPVSAKRPW